MMKTDASIRRFIALQRPSFEGSFITLSRTHVMTRDEMLDLFDRYEIYVWCVAPDKVTLKHLNNGWRTSQCH